MNMPLISIIMPVYNAECYLNQAILSCLNQSYKNIELILIDDGSTDKSIEIINNIINKDKRVKLFFTSTNQGPAAARNIGLGKAQGDYITFLDSDDFIANDKLEKQLNFMLQNHLVMTHGNYAFCDLEGNQIKLVTTSKKIDYLTLLQGNQFKIMTVLVKRESIKLLRFPNIKHEDYAFFLDCLKEVKQSILYSHQASSFVRIGKVSVSSNKFESAIWTFNIYFKREKLGVVKSIYYFILYAYNGFIKYKK